MAERSAFVVRSEVADPRRAGATPAAAASSLVLRPLDGAGPHVRFDVFDSADAAAAAGGEVFARVAEVRGRWTSRAGYAVFADWRVDDPAREAAFEESRQGLFEARRQHLPTFAFDWLLKRLDEPGRYTVLGLYGDEEGLRLCRAHPEVQRFAQQYPPTSLGATDVSGMRFFRVETGRG